jgi:PKD repeat protein
MGCGMIRFLCVKSGIVTIVFIMGLYCAPSLLAQDTPLDLRRLATLHQYDSWMVLGPEDPGFPTPNLTLSLAGVGGNEHQTKYQSKALTIFGLVQQGEIDPARLAEANALLRYAIGKWDASGPGDIIGQYAGAWNHRDRNLGVRLYYLYRDYMDSDIREDFDNRMDWAVDEPYDRKSENIKATNNSLIFLGHEVMGQTHLSSFTNVKNWWLSQLKSVGNDGFFEWGSNYNGSTLGAIYNLAEYAEDQQIKKLAEMVIDYTLGCSAGFQIDGYYNSPAVRQYGFWIVCPLTAAVYPDGTSEVHYYDTEIQTDIIHTLFFDAPPIEFWNTFVEWAVSNYRPLVSVEDMFFNSRGSETYLTSANNWHMYSYVMDRVAIATQHTLVSNYYASPRETHDIIQCIVQSDAGATNHVLTHAVEPRTSHEGSGPSKRRCKNDRSFGYQNIAIVNGGGYTKAVYASGGISDVPIRLFYSKDFTMEFASGWAFMTDGNIYVAWAPTIGDPVADPDSNTWTDPVEHGSWLKSDYTPPDDSDGEATVVEVGDPESFGTYQNFKVEILTRNSRPRWIADKVVYIASDGTEIEFGLDYAKLDGINVNLADYPRANSTIGIDNYTFSINGRTTQFNFDDIQVSGNQDRLNVSRNYGLPPGYPMAIIDAIPTSGKIPFQVSFDGSNSYDTGGIIVSYEWDFDNDGNIDAIGVTVQHIYQTAGNHTCKLTVTDNDNMTDYDTIQIQASTPLPPVAVFSADPATGYARLAVSFNASGSYDDDGNIVLYEWDFDNDAIIDATGVAPIHTYDIADVYTVTLTVTDDDDMTDSASTDITVMIPGDFDGDDDVDQEDYGHLQECMSGTGFIQNDPACLDALLDQDNDVDVTDVNIFRLCASGANNPADPGCAAD